MVMLQSYHMTLRMLKAYYKSPLVKFGGRESRQCGDISLFIGHVTSNDHVIKEVFS